MGLFSFLNRRKENTNSVDTANAASHEVPLPLPIDADASHSPVCHRTTTASLLAKTESIFYIIFLIGIMKERIR